MPLVGLGTAINSSGSTRPDKSLVVRCAFDRTERKIIFSSARNCSYQLFRNKIERCFALSASPFIVSYTDDDGQVSEINCEAELTEAILYFHSGGDNASTYSGHHSSSNKEILLRVDVQVDYNGPDLSDSGSIRSVSMYGGNRSRSPSELSFSLDDGSLRSYGREIGEMDDDVATVSSRPQSRVTGAHSQYHSRPSSFVVLSDQRSVSDRLNGGSSSQSSTMASSSNQHMDVLEKLKEQDKQTDPTAPDARGVGGTAEWLNKQKLRSRLVTLPEDSASEQGDVPNAEDYTIEVPGADGSESGGALALERGASGKFYFTYKNSKRSTRSNGSQLSYRSRHSHAPRASIESHRQSMISTSTQNTSGGVILGPSKRATLDQPFSFPDLVGTSAKESKEHSHPVISIEDAHNHPDIPPEVLQFLPSRPPVVQNPSDLTECSSCGLILDTWRYVCNTCGPKKPRNQITNADTLEDGEGDKGKGKESQSPLNKSSPQLSSSSWSDLARSSSLQTYPPYPINTSPSVSSRSRPLPALPNSNSPTSTSPSQSSQSPLLGRPPNRSSSSGSGSHIGSGTTLVSEGFELCMECMETAGIEHALESVLHTSSGPYGGSSSSLSSSGSGGGGSIGGNSIDNGSVRSWRRNAPKRKSMFRHAFTEKVWSTEGWTDVEQTDFHDCGTCGAKLNSPKYKCATCPNMVLCTACYAQVHEVHPVHAFLILQDKPPMLPAYSQLYDVKPTPNNQEGEEISMIHPDCKCIHCMQDIIGARFHCAICENVDICSNCESAGLPGNLDSSDKGHDSSHIMIKIPFPLQRSEVRNASRQARHLWTGRDAQSLNVPNRLQPTSSSSSLRTETNIKGRPRSNSGDSAYAATVLGANGIGLSPSLSGSEDDPIFQDHNVDCKGCGSNIVGIRFQCANCPALPGNSYSLCENCEARSYKLHNPMHCFFKIPRPLDRHIISETPLIPLLYILAAGESLGDIDPNNDDPKAYLSTIYHRSALCDRCVTRITGEWFRCAYCAKDLCDECEQLDQRNSHDPTHIFIVLKSVVDMAVLRTLTDVDNPEAGPPIIPYQVYLRRR